MKLIPEELQNIFGSQSHTHITSHTQLTSLMYEEGIGLYLRYLGLDFTWWPSLMLDVDVCLRAGMSAGGEMRELGQPCRPSILLQ